MAPSLESAMRNFGLAIVVVLTLGFATGIGMYPAQASLISTPPTIDFGTVLLGTTASQAIVLVADAGFVVSSAGGSGINAPFAFDQGTSNSDFTVFNSIESFTPVALGLVTGTLVIAECPPVGPCLPTDVPLRGIGVNSLPVPEPAGLLLFATGAALLMLIGGRKQPVAAACVAPTSNSCQPA